MSRARIALGLLAVMMGTAWWTGAINTTLASVVEVGPFVLVTVALVAGARAVAPRGRLIGPMVLLAVGGVWLLVRYGMLPRVEAGSFPALGLVVGGFIVALAGGNRSPRIDGVQRFHSFVLDRQPAALIGAAPAQVSITAVLSCIRIDLGDTTFPTSHTLQFDLTVFGGRIEVIVPADWVVAAGRIHAQGVNYEGSFDLTFLSPDQREQRHAVVNVIGWWGTVDLSARQ